MSVFRVELNAVDGGDGSTSGFLTVGVVRLGPPRFGSGDRGRLSFAEASVDNTGCVMWDVAGCDREGDRDMRLADRWRSQEGGVRLASTNVRVARFFDLAGSRSGWREKSYSSSVLWCGNRDSRRPCQKRRSSRTTNTSERTSSMKPR